MPGSSEVGSKRAQQLLTAVEIAQRYAFWKINQKPWGVKIDPTLKELVDAYGASADQELKNHFLLSLAQIEATLGG